MKFLRERRQQRIDRDVQEQADYVASTVQDLIGIGQEPPFVTYARVRGLSPENTAKEVGQAAIGQLGEQFMLDAKVTEEASSLAREGAIIRFVLIEE
jgi:hypothetical protein